MISKGQRAHRLERLRGEMERGKIDCLLISKPENYYYFSGFTGDYGFLLVTESRQIAFVDSRFTEQAKLEAEGFEIRQFDQMHRDLASLLGELHVKFIGFEDAHLSYADYRELERHSPDLFFLPARDCLERLRAIKDQEEVEKIKGAILIAQEALKEVLKGGIVGRTEEEIANDLEFLMRKKGATKSSFDLIVASGERSALPHGRASAKKVASGEILLCDWGALKDHYCSDLTRTFFVGQASSKERDIYKVVEEAQEAAISSLACGKTASEIHQKAQEVILNSPYKDYAFQHGLGHGVGLEIHELPRLSLTCQTPLLPGMVFTIEPGIYIPSWGGVRLEEMVLMGENTIDILTTYPKEPEIEVLR